MIACALHRTIMMAAFAAALASHSTSALAAESVADFYKGQELTILIGHPPGGAASKATAYFYNKAPRDGSVIALFPETIAYVQLMDPIQGKWDVARMRYIGSLAPVNTVFMIRKGAPAKSAQDLLTVRTNVGCSGRASQSYQYPATLKAVTGMPLNIICGYDGSSSYTLALLRGEVDMVSKAW